MANIDRMKKALAKAWPKDKGKIMSSDSYRLMNCWMQNDENRAKAAKALGVTSKCEMCAAASSCQVDGNPYLCRNGILQWLNEQEQ